MQAIESISAASVGVFAAVVAAIGLMRKVDIFDAFARGAKGGAGLALRILPYMVGMIFAVRIFEASGAFGYIAAGVQKLFGKLIPAEILPLVIMRPFSGGAAMGILAGILGSAGADSFAGRTASVYMGSSETLFYTCSLYLGSVGIKKTRYIIPVALITDFIGLIVSALLCALMT